MRYVVVSDVHSCFDKLISELERVHFNPEKDYLISNGDLFDRGPDPKKCLEYVMSLPHKIFLFGNHELELKRLLRTGCPEWHDFHNMTSNTLLELAGLGNDDYFAAAAFLRNQSYPISKLLNEYLDSCYYAAEFDKYVVTHAWLPCTYNQEDYSEVVDPEWDLSTEKVWYDACWTNPVNKCNSGAYLAGKTLVVGHRHAWIVAENLGTKRISEEDETIVDTSPFAVGGTVTDSDEGWVSTPNTKAVFIDGMTYYDKCGRVNAFVIHSRNKPKLVAPVQVYDYEILDD